VSVEALDAAPPADTPSRGGVLRRLMRDRIAAAAALVLSAIAMAAIFAPLLAPYDPYLTDLTKVMQPPSA